MHQHPPFPGGSPHPRHLSWDFPTPSHEALTAALDGDAELAYAAMLALQNCPPEMRVLAHLLLQRQATPNIPPTAAP